MSTIEKLKPLLWILPTSLALGLVLSLLDGGTWWIGLLSYSLMLMLGLWAISALWRGTGASRTLMLILLLSVLLRLGLGVGLSYALPAYGYDNEIQNAGYIFRDALNRDTQAWNMASSGESLWRAFDKSYSTDQYGGMLFLNAGLYRLFSPDLHRPWLVILVAALVAGIGVVLAFKAVGLAWGRKMAWIVAGILAFYPEAILQGSSQMREPFLITFVVMVFLGLVTWQEHRHISAAWWMAGGLVGMLLFNPSVAVFVLPVAAIWFWLWRGGRISWGAVLIVAGVLVAGIILLWLGLARGSLAGASLPETLSRWLGYSSQWDLYLTQRASDGLQPLFDALPKFLHLPLVTVYGLFQPVLPAIIFDVAPWPLEALGIFRALGWYLLLPFLFFAVFAGKGGTKPESRAWLWLWLATWAWILLSSFRAGGDQWDNPRYRVILVLFQAVLAARAWLYWRTSHNRWLGRLLTIEAVFLAVFGYWYAGRYTNWPILHFSFPVIILAIIVLAAAILVAGWAWDLRRHQPRS
jgi:4-amino-4-deoxy-L-arabinose transferase-like glycosyltransferase